LDDMHTLRQALHSLILFRSLLRDDALSLLSRALDAREEDELSRIDAYAAFVSALFSRSTNLTSYIWSRIVADENPYVQKRALGKNDPVLHRLAQTELAALSDIARLAGEQVQGYLGLSGLPAWETGPAAYAEEYERRMADIARVGYGMYARHNMFQFIQGELKPVRMPDPIRLSDLKGYARERELVKANTLALLGGRPAANVLLYGDAGTGKSATVKALVNEYAPMGLRLVEVKKSQLLDIPLILEQLRLNPLKFILFLDDLSFAQTSDETGVLKAILEGSASAKADNIAIYATSNRRHLVNEKFSDRSGDDIHHNETVQEQVSLSERFGLSVHFGKPNKDAYLEIVQAMLADRGLELGYEALSQLAERFALERGGRSPRTARQFVEMLLRERE
jgi:predicted AAA+ superfamily ATPase